MKIRIQLLDEKAKVPTFAHDDDAGMDIYALDNVTIEPGKRAVIHTGIAIELPKGTAALVWDKSGLAIGRGLKVLGGVMDAGYRGEYLICLHNLNDKAETIASGDKVAQILFQKVERPDIEITHKLTDTPRGEGRMGSTGI